MVQLAQTTMRSELGKITLDKTFEERDALNHSIVKSIQCALAPARAGASACAAASRCKKLRHCVCREAANAWGLQCMRYEIRDITGAGPCRCCLQRSCRLHATGLQPS